MAKKKTLKRVAAVLFALCALAAAVAGTSLLHSMQEYRAGDEDYAALKSIYLGTAPESGAVPTDPAEPEDPAAAFRRLETVCPGLTAWISIEGTPIDYPVMQAGDNDTYLDTTADGQKNAAGSIFLDSRNSGDYSDKNSILYGHALKNGKMFGSLKEYLDPAYWQAHPEITLTTPEGVRRYEIFAVCETTAGSVGYTRAFEDEAAFAAFLKTIREQSVYDTGVEPTPQDRVLTLSTCTNGARDRRYVVHARAVT